MISAWVVSAIGTNPKTPSQLFGEILREGAAVGVYVILWSNSYNNVDRALGRQLLREFEMRVAFQMSARRLQQSDRWPRRQPIGPAPGDPLSRRPRHHRKIPPLRPTFRRLAHLGQRPTPPQRGTR